MSTPRTTVAEFTVWDYVVFVIMLLISASIGVYHAIKARGQQSNSQFLLGDRQLRALPVAMSLTASFMSAVTVIGTPAEVYRFGAMFLIFCISYAIVTIVSAEFFLPVFYRLNITSTYEYLNMRFNKLARYIGTIFYITQTVLYTGIVIYAPALALNQVTGLDLWGVLVATGLVCTFYCTLGGLKAVVWTDVFQMGIMISGFLAVIIRGVVIQGSFERIWNISYHGGRLNFWDFDPNPLRRHTFWTIVVGGSFMWTAIYGINQSQVQRYIACKNKFEAKLSLYLNMVGLWITAFCAVFTGLTTYSIYHECDPLTEKKIKASDQLLPYLVMDIMRDYPGVPGLFVAAAYSGTLSTVSSSINALAAVTVEDVIKPYTSLSEQKLAWVTKGLSLMYGVICIGMAALSSLMGSVLQGALSGLAISFLLTMWMGIGGQVYQPLPDQTRPLPLSTAGCFFNITDTPEPVTGSPWTTINQDTEVTSRPVIADTLYSISYLYLSPIGTMLVLILGLIISLLTGGMKNTVDKKLLVTYSDMLCFSYLANKCIRSENTIANEELEGIADTGKVNPTFSDQELNNSEKQNHIVSATHL
ncbi:sodium-coupled monocarboxylate transporter 1 isoform X2 [Stegostoma tigrinum]|uniref:sodium-coupled monocarboxylate transporter 1 isoform X2 n=1 Tax=Stegostoma tigrinum TaxID=3053191 RepID=UPI00202B5F9D|nr:sodium-coupled monocarboxylate transporter 1 isoform X2 [Stegostoma tigrinum]